jgi:hypothetical protein
MSFIEVFAWIVLVVLLATFVVVVVALGVMPGGQKHHTTEGDLRDESTKAAFDDGQDSDPCSIRHDHWHEGADADQ